jgi:hypothetical protein
MVETRKLRSVPQVEIRIPALPKATKEKIAYLYDGFKWLKADDSPEEEEVVLIFATVLFEGEWHINKHEFLARLPDVKKPLGVSQGLWLCENYQLLSEEAKKALVNIFLEFPATRMVDKEDEETVLYIHFDGSDLSPFFDRRAHSFKHLEHAASDYIAVVKEG